MTPLPGLGTQQGFTTHAGNRVGVTNYRDGRLELIVSEQEDPDKVVVSIELTTAETSTLANLLGAPQLVSRLSEQQREVSGITTWQLPIASGSPYAGRQLGKRSCVPALPCPSWRSFARVPPTPHRVRTSCSLAGTSRVGTVDGLRAADEVLERG